MEVKNPMIQKTEFSPEQFVKNIYNTIIVKKKENILIDNISLNIKENSKLYFNFFLICFIILANIVLVTKRWTSEKKNKCYIKYYNALYHDFLKYLFVEFAIAINNAIENNKFNITSSLSRIAIVLTALLFFHSFKGIIGIE